MCAENERADPRGMAGRQGDKLINVSPGGHICTTNGKLINNHPSLQTRFSNTDICFQVYWIAVKTRKKKCL